MSMDFDNILKNEVEQIFSQSINDKRACELLSFSIQREIKENISYQTIRRYWNLAKSVNPVSLQSKNILCRYAGFNDFDNFIEYFTTNKETAKGADWNIIKDWYTVRHNDKPLNDSVYWHDKLSQTFAQFILTNEFVFDSFSKAMHTNEVAMKYIISYHPMYDNLAKKWYFRGLNLFIRSSNEFHYKLFEAVLLFMGNAFICKNENLSFYAEQIEFYLPKVRKKYGVVWSLEARSIPCLLYYFKLNNNEKRFNELKQDCLELATKKANERFEVDNNDLFVLFVSDYCNMFQLSDLSIQLQEIQPINFKEKKLWQNGYETASLIIKAITLFLDNKGKESKTLFEQVEISNLNFDFKKYFSIQYRLLELGFCNKMETKNKIKIEIYKLIDETGLIYFETLISVFENNTQ
ncbi:MAG: hypothetical protein WCJ62_10170 [Flavobacterium sp.]